MGSQGSRADSEHAQADLSLHLAHFGNPVGNAMPRINNIFSKIIPHYRFHKRVCCVFGMFWARILFRIVRPYRGPFRHISLELINYGRYISILTGFGLRLLHSTFLCILITAQDKG